MSAPVEIRQPPVVGKLSSRAAWLDLGLLLKETPKPISWLIDGVLPAGACGDIFGPPGGGKSSLVLSMALQVAAGGGEWFGRRVAGGRVMILGGEKSSKDVWVRDLARGAQGLNKEIEPDRILALAGDVGPIWAWTREGWDIGEGYDLSVAEAKEFRPTLTIIDTIGRGALGQDPIDIAQQQQLANMLEKFRARIGGTLLTVSHTNQASGKDTLRNRLRYESRAGGNGLPGHLRWLLAVTPVRAEESALTFGVDLDDEAEVELHEMRRIIAVAVSKHNEMPAPADGWAFHTPHLFEMMQDGSLLSLGVASASMLENNAETFRVHRAAKQSEKGRGEKAKSTRKRVYADRDAERERRRNVLASGAEEVAFVSVVPALAPKPASNENENEKEWNHGPLV